MYTRRNPVFAAFAITAALVISFSLISSPYLTYAQEAATTTTNEIVDPQMQTEENAATNVEPTGETFAQQSLAATTTTAGEGGEGTTNGQDGSDAQVPGQVLTATSTDGTGGQSGVGGTVITGDATATTTVQNEMNTNTADVNNGPGETNSSSLTSSTTNEAELGSNASSTAETGDNQAEGGEGLATIVTGVAIATANVINVVNTNIFNSVGLIVFLNQLFGGGFDFRNLDLSYFFDDPATTSGTPTGCNSSGTGCESECTLLTCLNSSQLNVVNTNTATVTNSVIVRARTGENVASSTGDGGAQIQTGDAYAAANVLNLVNTNVINSKYLVVSFNNFGNLVQDITLPTASFFHTLLGRGATMPSLNSSTFDVHNTSTTTFNGDTTASADTGNNTALTGTSTITDYGATSTSTSTPQGAEIQTGNAYSMANSVTQANTNIVGATSLMMLFRVWGNWSGEVVGLPAGLKAINTSDGFVIMTENGSEEMARNMGEYNSSAFLASSTNTAVVDNNVDVGASTGNNQTMTESGASRIETGDAYAVANVTNLVNTNIVNGNWIFGVFNIFGDWSGDIAFGHPDLSLEAVAVTPEPTISGSEISYVFKVKNTGDMDATNVTLSSVFDGSNLSIPAIPESVAGNPGAWNLGTIKIGESKEFAVKGTVTNTTNSSFTIPLTATVGSSATDNDPRDNSKLVTVVVNGPQLPQPSIGGGAGGGGGGGGGFGGAIVASPTWTKDPVITVTKSASMTSASLPATIDYKVVVKNDTAAGPAYKGVLTDVLYDPEGKVVYKRSWDLQTIEKGDEITLTYSVEFANTTKPGIYKNVATVTGLRNYPTVGFGGMAINVSEATANVEFSAGGEVLGVTASAPVTNNASGACGAYINSFMARGLRNNAGEVRKLQQFLNTNMNAGLPVTGTYGPLTTARVRAFQSSQGITPVSGNVYSLTQGAINRVICGGDVTVSTPTVPNTGAVAKAPVKSKTVAKKPVKKTTAKVPAATKSATKPVAKPVVTAPVKPTEAKAQPTKGFTSWLKGIVKTVSAQSQ